MYTHAAAVCVLLKYIVRPFFFLIYYTQLNQKIDHITLPDIAHVRFSMDSVPRRTGTSMRREYSGTKRKQKNKIIKL